jgi:hypothetical protein
MPKNAKLDSTVTKPGQAEKRSSRQSGCLTAAGRERLRQAILERRPWQWATGPKTSAGKAKSALNGKARQKGEKSAQEKRTEFAVIHRLMKSMGDLRTRVFASLR